MGKSGHAIEDAGDKSCKLILLKKPVMFGSTNAEEDERWVIIGVNVSLH